MKTKLVCLVHLLILINSQWTQCDSEFDNEREKRTVGIFFRSFIDAFQTQRQPAPNVVSFKPSKQLKPQSIKADILSSSKTLVLQKSNLLKSSIPISITKAPKVAVPQKPTTIPSPSTLPPKALAEPVTQVPQPQVPSPDSPVAAPLHPLPNPLPPSGPLKAQVLIFPFQTHQVPETPYAGFGLQPDHHSGISPHNYQAEFYLQPSVGGVQHSSGDPSGPYSPDNGWHDVEEIFSKGIQTASVEGGKVETKNDEFGKLKNIELKKYEVNIESEPGYKNCAGNPTSTEHLPFDNGKCHENIIDDQKKYGHYQNYFGGEFGGLHYLPPQIFVPHLSQSVDKFGNNYKGFEDNFQSADKSHKFHQLFDEAFKKLAPEGFNIKLEPQAVQDRARVSDVGVLRNRTWSENTDLGINNTSQQNVDSKFNESLQEKFNHNVPTHIPHPGQNHFFSEYGQLYIPEHNPVHYSEHNVHQYENVPNPKLSNVHIANLDTYYNSNYDTAHIQDDQLHTSIGNLPNGYLETGTQHRHSPTIFHNPSPTYDSNADYTEINNSHPNGYYHFKRSYKRQI